MLINQQQLLMMFMIMHTTIHSSVREYITKQNLVMFNFEIIREPIVNPISQPIKLQKFLERIHRENPDWRFAEIKLPSLSFLRNNIGWFFILFLIMIMHMIAKTIHFIFCKRGRCCNRKQKKTEGNTEEHRDVNHPYNIV